MLINNINYKFGKQIYKKPKKVIYLNNIVFINMIFFVYESFFIYNKEKNIIIRKILLKFGNFFKNKIIYNKKKFWIINSIKL